MSALELDAIEARANAATSGPWVSSEAQSEHPRYAVTSEAIELEDQDDTIAGHVLDYTDSVFIAHAREDVPALIAKVRESNEQAGRIATALELCEELEASPVRGVRYIGAEFRRALTGETK